ncbi:hypothetical protein IWW47_005526, partial [Coemansia sp. RSA 2052]
MVSTSLSSTSSSLVGGHNKNNNNHHNSLNPAVTKGDDLLAGRLPAARISYDQPAEGQRVNGAIIALVRNSELDGLRKSIRMFEDRFNRRFKYPYVLLNDQNFTQEFRDGIAAITNNEVRYGILDSDLWGYSSSVTPERTTKKLEENKNRYLYGGSL